MSMKKITNDSDIAVAFRLQLIFAFSMIRLPTNMLPCIYELDFLVLKAHIVLQTK